MSDTRQGAALRDSQKHSPLMCCACLTWHKEGGIMGKAPVFPRTYADAQWTEEGAECVQTGSERHPNMLNMHPLISFGLLALTTLGLAGRSCAGPVCTRSWAPPQHCKKRLKKKIQMHSQHRDQGCSQTVPCMSLRNCSDSQHPNKSQVWRGTSVAQGLREMRWGQQPHSSLASIRARVNTGACSAHAHTIHIHTGRSPQSPMQWSLSVGHLSHSCS